MRRRWLAMLALAGFASTAAFFWVRPKENMQPAPPPLAAGSAGNPGTLPLSLPDESPLPARLSGQIESIEPDDSLFDLSAGATPQADSVPSPPPLGDAPWRPSARMASFQVSSGDAAAARGSTGGGPKPAAHETESLRYVVHRVVDGDTLSGLAQRYLGSSQRSGDIFKANCDRLASPELLPIGLELRIPVAEGGPSQ